MRIENHNLYDHFSIQKPQGAAGNLECFLPLIPEHYEAGRSRPAVLVIPGGGYSAVSDRESEPVAIRFLNRGYAAFVLHYSVAPVRFPAALREAAMAMRYIRENAERFKVDPHMVAAIGFSAGGHLCGSIGTMFDCPEVADIGDAAMLRPDALGLCYPVLVSWGKTNEGTFQNLTGGDAALRERVSLERQVRPDMPPAFIWHTRNDPAVPSRNSLIFAQAMDDLGLDYSLRIYKNGAHGLSTADDVTYLAHAIPEHSADVNGWEDLMIDYFRELGIRIRDRK